MFQVVSVLLCLFTWCGQSDENLPLLTRVPEIINHLCPGSNVCSNNRTSTTSDDNSFKPGTESCCAECSCLSTCTNTGNCCYPNTFSTKMIFEINDFRNDRSCLYPMIPQPSVDHHLYQSFLMVSSVPRPDTVGVSNVSCGDMNVAPWGSFYPVYSAKSKQVYKNIECAREDGSDSDVILWNAVINCEDTERDQGIIMVVTGLEANSMSKSCRINFVFPGDIDVLHPLKCFTNLIDTCTASSEFEVPDGINVSKDDIRALCTKSGFVSPYRATKMYANVFCHICSAEIFHRKLFCNKHSGDLNVKGKNGYGFVALIDGKFITENIDTGETRNQIRPIACSVKQVDKCRQILCPTGQLRNRISKCVYPNKIWYNQNYAVYVNLTSVKSINVSEVFGIKYGTILPSLKSVWLKRWVVDSIYFRVMDVPYMSNNFLICIHRRMSMVKPDIMITNIKKMIGQAWSIRLGNDTEMLTSSNFSILTEFLRYRSNNNGISFFSLTENVEIPQYKRVYVQSNFAPTQYLITRLYICDQVELEPSEFLLSDEMGIIYSYITKRFMFDSEFTLVQSPIDGKFRARICIGDSKLRATIINFGTMRKPSVHCFVVTSMVLILLQQSLYHI